MRVELLHGPHNIPQHKQQTAKRSPLQIANNVVQTAGNLITKKQEIRVQLPALTKIIILLRKHLQVIETKIPVLEYIA